MREVIRDRGVLEGPHIGRYERSISAIAYKTVNRDCFGKEGGHRYAGSGRYHLVAHRQGDDHQQRRLQRSCWNQRKYINKFDQIQTLLGADGERRRRKWPSINLSNDPSRHYKEVWIGFGRRTVGRLCHRGLGREKTDVTPLQRAKRPRLFALAEKLDGDLEAAIRQLARKRR